MFGNTFSEEYPLNFVLVVKVLLRQYEWLLSYRIAGYFLGGNFHGLALSNIFEGKNFTNLQEH